MATSIYIIETIEYILQDAVDYFEKAPLLVWYDVANYDPSFIRIRLCLLNYMFPKWIFDLCIPYIFLIWIFELGISYILLKRIFEMCINSILICMVILDAIIKHKLLYSN